MLPDKAGETRFVSPAEIRRHLAAEISLEISLLTVYELYKSRSSFINLNRARILRLFPPFRVLADFSRNRGDKTRARRVRVEYDIPFLTRFLSFPVISQR